MVKKIDANVQATGRKQFKLSPEKNGGLSIGKLTEVRSVEAGKPTPEDSKYVNFRGRHLPMLEFIFESVKGEGTYVKRFTAYDPEFDAESKYPGSNWDQISTSIVHFLEVFKGAALDSKDYKNLSFDDEKKEDELVKEFTNFFTAVANLFTNYRGEGKPIYNDESGNPIVVWMKLLISIKGRPINNGNPGLPNYPGDGIIERYTKGQAPYISIKPAKGESIEDKAPVAAPIASPTPTSATSGADLDLDDY